MVSVVISYLNLKTTQKTFIHYAKYITNIAVDNAKRILDVSRRAAYKRNTEQNELVDQDVKCDVSIDGSWHRRGHKSNYGVGAVADVNMGLILDHEVCSKLCC